MGLGKTAQAIRAADAAGASRVLIVAPAAMRTPWQEECAKWSLTDRHITTNPETTEPRATIVVSYEGMTAHVAALRKFRPDVVIFDEAKKLKEKNSSRTRAALLKKGVAGAAGAMWFLEGTPIPNNPSELWTLLRACGQSNESQNAFKNHFCIIKDTDRGEKIVGVQNVDELRQRLAAIMLRRLKRDELTGLPPIQHRVQNITPLEADPAALSQLKLLESAIADEMRRAIAEGDFNLASVEHVATARKLIGLAKAPHALRCVAARLLTETDQIVLFAQHRGVLDLIAAHFAPWAPVFIHGGTSSAKRSAAIRDFQTGRARVIGCQIDAAACGLTLTAAHHLDMLEQSWTPANNEQAIARVHRVTQTREVIATTHHLAGSLDDLVKQANLLKNKMISAILD